MKRWLALGGLPVVAALTRLALHTPRNSPPARPAASPASEVAPNLSAPPPPDDVTPPDDVAESEPPTPAAPRRRLSGRLRLMVIGGAVALTLVLASTLYILSNVLSKTAAVQNAASQSQSQASDASGTLQWRRHTDTAAGFSIDYPDAWQSFPVTDRPGVQFLAGPDSNNLVEVRVITLPGSVGAADTATMKGVVDQTLTGQQLNIVSETQVSYGGMQGWQYVYGIQDATGVSGVHVHVFLFQGNKLHTIMFQALPSTGLKALAPTFDAVLARYRSLAAPAASAAATPAATAASTPAASAVPTP